MSLLNCTSLKFSDSFQLSCSLLSRRPMTGVKSCAHSNADREGRTDKSADTWTSCMNAAMHMMHAWSL